MAREDGLVQTTCRLLKKELPEMVLIPMVHSTHTRLRVKMALLMKLAMC